MRAHLHLHAARRGKGGPPRRGRQPLRLRWQQRSIVRPPPPHPPSHPPSVGVEQARDGVPAAAARAHDAEKLEDLGRADKLGRHRRAAVAAIRIDGWVEVSLPPLPPRPA